MASRVPFFVHMLHDVMLAKIDWLTGEAIPTAPNYILMHVLTFCVMFVCVAAALRFLIWLVDRKQNVP